MRRPPVLKEIRWRGDSRIVAHDFPRGARLKLGKELTRIQLGLMPRAGKWLIGVGPGVQEIRIAHGKEAYRVIYIAIFAEIVYVLHSFHKKSKAGIATPKEHLTLAVKRYQDLANERKRR